MTFESTRRPLTDSERRLLQARIRDLRARGQRRRTVAAPVTAGLVLVPSKFPSLDFSLVYILDERDQTVDMVIEKRGPKARPAKIIPASVTIEGLWSG